MVLLFIVLFFLLLLIFFIIWIHTLPLKRKEADVLVILGYKCVDNKLHPFLEERLKVAIELIQSFQFKKVIVTGGQVGSTISEAEIMKSYLAKNGVDKESIILENEATDTIENLVNCKKIMKECHLNTSIIVSNSFHLRRIHYIAHSIGFTSDFYCYRNSKDILKQGIRSLNEIRIFIKTHRLLKVRKTSLELMRKEGDV